MEILSLNIIMTSDDFLTAFFCFKTNFCIWEQMEIYKPQNLNFGI